MNFPHLWFKSPHLLLGRVLLRQQPDAPLQLSQLSVFVRKRPPKILCLHLGLLQLPPKVGRLPLTVAQELQAVLLVLLCQKLCTGPFLQLGRFQGFMEDPDQLLQDSINTIFKYCLVPYLWMTFLSMLVLVLCCILQAVEEQV